MRFVGVSFLLFFSYVLSCLVEDSVPMASVYWVGIYPLIAVLYNKYWHGFVISLCAFLYFGTNYATWIIIITLVIVSLFEFSKWLNFRIFAFLYNITFIAFACINREMDLEFSFFHLLIAAVLFAIWNFLLGLSDKGKALIEREHQQEETADLRTNPPSGQNLVVIDVRDLQPLNEAIGQEPQEPKTTSNRKTKTKNEGHEPNKGTLDTKEDNEPIGPTVDPSQGSFETQSLLQKWIERQ